MKVAVAAFAALLLSCSAQAANFETATVDGYLNITSEWDGGFCGSLTTRNPGNNPSTSWAGLFTFYGGELTTGPNGNGVGNQLSPSQWTFTPTDPAQMAIFPHSTVIATFCCNAADNAQVQASFRVIFSYDYRGAGYSPPPSPPPPAPSPPPPSPSPPSPSPPMPPSPSPPSPSPPMPPSPSPPSPSPPSPPPQPPVVPSPEPAPAQAPSSIGDLVAAAPEGEALPSPAPAPEGTFGITEASLTTQPEGTMAAGAAASAPPAFPTTSAASAVQGVLGLVAAAVAVAATLLA